MLAGGSIILGWGQVPENLLQWEPFWCQRGRALAPAQSGQCEKGTSPRLPARPSELPLGVSALPDTLPFLLSTQCEAPNLGETLVLGWLCVFFTV